MGSRVYLIEATRVSRRVFGRFLNQWGLGPALD